MRQPTAQSSERQGSSAGFAGRLWAFIRLGRPLFLGGGVVLYALGAAAALADGAALDLRALLWGQAAVTAVQWMTHYGNDYFDLPHDRANRTPTAWSGGSRVLVEGRLRPRAALIAALAFAVAALGVWSALAFAVGAAPAGLIAILAALGLAWSYSGPPLRLNARGFGEATLALIVPLLTPLTGYALQADRVGALPLLAAAPLMALQLAMRIIIDLPDAASDAATGKRTLVVRLGDERSARLHNGLIALAYATLPVLVLAGLPGVVALAAAGTAPLAMWQAWRMGRGAYLDPAAWDSLAFGGIALLMGTAAAELLAMLAVAGRGM
jgi:1,4-dihydroxy-2-naphthoate octaprenyltransferase